MTTSQSRAGEAVKRFFFQPASAAPIAVLRVGVAVTLLFQAAALAPDVGDFYGSLGILQRGWAPEATGSPIAMEGWLTLTARLGLPEAGALALLGALYLGSLVGLLTGRKTRVFAVVAWLTHLVWINDQVTAYGVDLFAHVSLFFLVFLPDRSGPRARLGLRALQIYLCIAYLASGLEKAIDTQWWNGEAIWRSLLLPSLAQWDMTWVAQWPVVAKMSGWLTLVAEIGYAVFIWPRATRRLWLALILGLHAGIAVFLGLWLFSLIMIVMNVAAFATPAELERAGLGALKPEERPREKAAVASAF